MGNFFMKIIDFFMPWLADDKEGKGFRMAFFSDGACTTITTTYEFTPGECNDIEGNMYLVVKDEDTEETIIK